MAYLLDANVFIQAKNLHYGFDFCPAFWDWLEQSSEAAVAYSLNQVRDELIGGGDELSDWVRGPGSALFRAIGKRAQADIRWLAAWVESNTHYDQSAKTVFLNAADFFLVAEAKAHGHVLVTHEVSSDTKKRIKIPEACLVADVEYTSPYRMLKREQARFVLR